MVIKIRSHKRKSASGKIYTIKSHGRTKKENKAKKNSYLESLGKKVYPTNYSTPYSKPGVEHNKRLSSGRTNNRAGEPDSKPLARGLSYDSSSRNRYSMPRGKSKKSLKYRYNLSSK